MSTPAAVGRARRDGRAVRVTADRAADAGRQRRDVRQPARRSCASAPTGSASSAPPSRPAPSCARSAATPCAPGVAEVELGTPLREVIERVGGGARPGHEIVAVMSGVANPLLPASALDTPITYEDLRAAGGGLGAAGFIVFDDTTDLVAVAAGVAHFLAVESCGQCRHCKDDGLVLADVAGPAGRHRTADRARRRRDRPPPRHRRRRVPGAISRPSSRTVVGSVLQQFPAAVGARTRCRASTAPSRCSSPRSPSSSTAVRCSRSPSAPSSPTGPTTPVDSGQWPADRLDEHRRDAGVE